MRVLIDVNHPAHVHFFKNPGKLLLDKGHDVLFTSRDKDVTIALLDELELKHQTLSRLGQNKTSLLKELLTRDHALLKEVRAYNPDIMLSVGGTFIAHTGFLTRTPSVVFYDTETAILQNLITYPFASLVVVPRCYSGWLPKRHLKYAGYHELAYLHPNYFTPDLQRALAAGLSPNEDNYLIRVVAWQANHDIGQRGWDEHVLGGVVNYLSLRGTVHISSEQALPREFDAYRYQGKASDLHHLLAFCRACIGESATLASEASVLGVPSIFAADTTRSYVSEQQSKYGLVRCIREVNSEQIKQAHESIASFSADYWRQQQSRLLADTIDPSRLVFDIVENFNQQSGRRPG